MGAVAIGGVSDATENRLLAAAILVAVFVILLAWLGDSVGGAGYWNNVGWILLGFGRLAAFIAFWVGVVWVVGVLVTGDLTWKGVLG